MSNIQCHCGSTDIYTVPTRGDSVCKQCGLVVEDSRFVYEVQFTRAVEQFVTCEEKEEKRASEEEENANKPDKKRKHRPKRGRIQASTAGGDIEKMLLQKKISFKLNYDVLKSLNPKEALAETATLTADKVPAPEDIVLLIRRSTKSRIIPKVPSAVPLNIKKGMSGIMGNSRKKEMLAVMTNDEIKAESLSHKNIEMDEAETGSTPVPMEIILDDTNEEQEDEILEDDEEEEDYGSDDEGYFKSELLNISKEDEILEDDEEEEEYGSDDEGYFKSELLNISKEDEILEDKEEEEEYGSDDEGYFKSELLNISEEEEILEDDEEEDEYGYDYEGYYNSGLLNISREEKIPDYYGCRDYYEYVDDYD